MIRNYIITALRQLSKSRFYSSLNTVGLVAGVICFLLITVYVNHERSYDNFHHKADRIYRLNLGSLEANKMSSCITAGVMPSVLKDEYTGIESFVRFRHLPSMVSFGTKVFFEDRFFFSDSTLFNVFSFTLLEGNERTALAEPFSIVLTQSVARKYFGDNNAVGELLTVDQTMTFKVTGIMADVPSNSHVQFDMVASTESLPQHPQPNVGTWQLTSWYSHYFHNYVLLDENADPARVGANIRDAAKYHSDQTMYESFGKNMGLFLQPLKDIHLNPMFGEIEPQGDRKILIVLSGAAALVLLLAGINFANINMMLSLRRHKEVGLRKTLGARKLQVYLQFIGESFLLCLITFVIGFAIMQATLPFFNTFTGKNIGWAETVTAETLIIVFIVAALVSVVGGFYPSLTAGTLSAAKILKGMPVARGSMNLKRAIVIFQFTITIELIAGSLVVRKQVDHMLGKDLGLNTNHVIVLPTRGDPAVNAKLELFFDQLREIPSVNSATTAELIPGQPVYGIVGIFEGYEIRNYRTMGIGYDYLKTFGMELLSGRDFSRDIQTDTSTNCVIINESLCKLLGWTAEQAIGKSYNMGNEVVRPGTVVGVVKDFHFNSLRNEIQPLVMSYIPHFFSQVPVRINSNDMQATIDAVKNAWSTVYPQRPFEFSFADMAIQQQYQSEQKFGKLITSFSFIATIIGLLGLVGMISLDLATRTKEIGIRKVLGADVAAIVGLLSRSFFILVIIAAIVSIPLSVWLGEKWLAGFAFRIDSVVMPVLVPAAAVVAIAGIVIAVQTLRTAATNPVDSLRTE